MSEAATCELIRRVLELESQAIRDLIPRVEASAAKAVEALAACRGRVITTGMGKMGCIARKAAATLASTGTPAIFLHASEALHGDLGIASSSDILLALSNSGETDELIRLIPFMQRASIPIICLTGSPKSTLAQASAIVIDTGVSQEADPECPAPTSSTTAALAMCDALAVALMRRRGLTRDQFAIFHPGGQLGRKLLLTVADLMKTGNKIPIARPDVQLREAIVRMSRGGLGAVFVQDPQERLMGILTDGDLRRIFESKSNPLDKTLDELMVRHPKQIGPCELAAAALRQMESHSITVLPVVDSDGRIVGALHLHDLLQAQLA
jgi:arabinose-5-phosphate isomerase